MEDAQDVGGKTIHDISDSKPPANKAVRVNARGQVRPRLYKLSSDSTRQKDAELKSSSVLCETAVADRTMDVEMCDTSNASEEVVEMKEGEETDHYVMEDATGPHMEEDNTAYDNKFETENDEETDSFFSDETMNKPIYDGHTMTLVSSVLMIWIYAMTHSITGSELADLLTIINAHCLYEIPLYSSLQRFKKVFADLKTPLVKHFYCSFCLMKVNSDTKICPNVMCSKSFQTIGKSYFIEFPLENQLKALFKREAFRENLKHRFRRVKKNRDALEDIYDGDIYKSLSGENQPLADINNISLTWNTDGVPVFKSSKISIWPMYLMINELPCKERKRKSNMLFYGLWFGETKPLINLFCGPLLETLVKLETEGVLVSFEQQKVLVKAFLICGTADLPAKSTALNMNQFNGEYSCSRCLQKGRTEKAGKGHTHIFPFSQENPVGPERTQTDVYKCAVEATKSKKTVCGIKGPSFLSGLKSYDIVLSTSIDYMHCVLLGITKRLLTLWFTTSFASETFSLIKEIEEVDNRLLKIKPSYHVTRRPRSISEHLKYWKASELRAWLLFYSVPVLADIMLPVYYFHYCALVESIWILCKDSILSHEIERSFTLLNYFVLMLEPLYGARYCTLNSHSLLHLPRCVQDLGPLWAYSCFSFESFNGELLKLFHGTQAIETQIIGAVNIHQMLPALVEKLPSSVKELSIIKQFDNSSKISLGLCIDHDVYVVGNAKNTKLTKLQKEAFKNKMGFMPHSLKFYARMMVRGLLLHSEIYTRVICRNSFTVKYISNENVLKYGSIKMFAVYRGNVCSCESTCTCKKEILACMDVFEKLADSVLDMNNENYPKYLNLRVGHIQKSKLIGKVEVVEIHKILSVCLNVSFSDDLHFICEYPNLLESD